MTYEPEAAFCARKWFSYALAAAVVTALLLTLGCSSEPEPRPVVAEVLGHYETFGGFGSSSWRTKFLVTRSDGTRFYTSCPGHLATVGAKLRYDESDFE